MRDVAVVQWAARPDGLATQVYLAGPRLLVAGAVYFAICGGRGRRVARPLFAIVVVAGLSVQVIETGAVQMVRWVLARPASARDRRPSARPRDQTAPQLRYYWATVHAIFDGTVLLEFDKSWAGLLYVPAGLPAPDRRSGAISAEVMPRWWFYDTGQERTSSRGRDGRELNTCLWSSTTDQPCRLTRLDTRCDSCGIYAHAEF